MSALQTDLLDARGAAESLGVDPKTIRRWVAAGRLPAYRLGPRVLRIRRSDIEALFERIPTAGGAR